MSEDKTTRFLAFQATPETQKVKSMVAERLNAMEKWDDWMTDAWRSDDFIVERVWLVTETYRDSVVALTPVDGDEAVHSCNEPVVVLVELKDTVTGETI